MDKKYLFCKATVEEASCVFALVTKRIAWMDKNNIHQWNELHYETIFPLSYYQDRVSCSELYVIKRFRDDKVACGGVIKRNDEWGDKQFSFYLHNLVSSQDDKGVGALFLRETEKLALREHAIYLRLDCDSRNLTLNSYYEMQGYLSVGECEEGPYHGIRRQKRLAKPRETTGLIKD